MLCLCSISSLRVVKPISWKRFFAPTFSITWNCSIIFVIFSRIDFMLINIHIIIILAFWLALYCQMPYLTWTSHKENADFYFHSVSQQNCFASVHSCFEHILHCRNECWYTMQPSSTKNFVRTNFSSAVSNNFGSKHNTFNAQPPILLIFILLIRMGHELLKVNTVIWKRDQ